MKKNLVLIETLHTGSGLEIIKAAKNKGIKIHFITAEYSWFENNCPAELAEEINIILVDWEKTSVREEYLKLIHGKEKFALFTQRDAFVEAVAEVAEEFKLNFTSSKAMKIARNKEKMREYFSHTLIPSPKYCYVNSKEDLLQSLTSLVFPLIAKPTKGSGSKDVIIIHNETDLSMLDKFFNKETAANLLLEEFKLGRVVSVESFTNNGKHHILGVTNRLMGSHPYFVELGYAFPCHYENTLQTKLEEYTKYILDKTEYKFGFSHIEYILGQDEVYLVEINARLGGAQLGKLMSHSLNLNIYELLIENLFEFKEFELDFNNIQATAGYIVYSQKPGVIDSIKGIDLASKFPNVLEVILGLKIGDYAKETNDMMGHVVQVIATGNTTENALISAHSAATYIIITVK
ncbi:ATP-grasp domain-containing protein [Fluviispira multicolorata]|uniref:ATP-grasp domain-containing protein n=1 Tax=Fluviispira multicolorata TaxID=2654512 RepID=A0A833N3L7_9BACT|nr:ATP-grasp domain-containing protein [Fluviispira multicolorata]KAB8028623.1 ATP-grasp domain-containing protein [Fluviispira multicolorata]